MTFEILRISHLKKFYNAKRILDDIHLTLNRGERAALVGENGTGKTTLARIITGQEAYDAGTIRLADGATLGYLPQEVTAHDAQPVSVRQYIAHATGNLDAIQAEMRQLEAQMSQSLPDDTLQTVLARYGELQETFVQRGGYDLDYRMAQIFAGLRIDYLETDRDINTLSGGERTRVALAALLLREPDLLVLDEPTNHLDFAGIEWLEQYLAQYTNALLLITHDRQFINRVVNQIIELSPVTGGLTIYHGDYEAYLAQRDAAYQAAVDAYNNQQNEMKQLQRVMRLKANNTSKGSPANRRKIEGDKFLKHFKRENNEDQTGQEIRQTRQKLDDLQENHLDNPRHTWRIAYHFDPLPLPSSEPLRFANIRKAFDGQCILDAISGTIMNGQRVVIVAPNGTGKSTLLQILTGALSADSGTVQQSPSAHIGYLDQDASTLDPEQAILDCFREVAPVGSNDKDLMAQLHRSGLFADANLAHKRVCDLSVGQRRKLALARLVVARFNVLLLDEPTNHLDFASIEALEAALLTFPGAVLAVSHDRRFINRVATHIWHLRDGQLMQEPARADADTSPA